MSGAVGWSGQGEESAAFEDAIEESLSKVIEAFRRDPPCSPARLTATGMSQPARMRRLAVIELVVLVVLAGIGLGLFADGSLDRAWAAVWHANSTENPWPGERAQPWRTLYLVGAWPGLLLAAAAAAALVAGAWLIWLQPWRRQALAIVLMLALGPGLVVNGVLKNHWGRPRPRDTVELGGTQTYLAPWVKGESGRGKSFPCGHCAMGFFLGLGWFVLRRRRPGWAVACLAGGTVAGVAIGVARMAAGGHFASDVWWAGVLVWGIGWLVWHPLLNVDRYKDDLASGRIRPSRPSWPMIAVGGTLGLGLLIGGLVATPASRAVREKAVLDAPVDLTLDLPAGNVVLTLSDAPGFKADGEILGFGFPGSRIRTRLEDSAEGGRTASAGAAAVAASEPSAPRRLRLVVTAKGWFSELGGQVNVALDRRMLAGLEVNLGQGDFSVVGGEAQKPGWLRIEVGKGEVKVPAGWK